MLVKTADPEKEGTMSLRVIQGGGFRQRRKATKIERLKTELSIAKLGNSELIARLKTVLKVLKEFEEESNWAVKDGHIIWLGEGEPNTVAGAALARIRGASAAFDEKADVVEDGPGTPAAPLAGTANEETKEHVIFGPDSFPAGGMVEKKKEDK